MTEELKTTIQEEVAKLPQQHQKAIGSLDWTQITERIANNYSLSLGEINDLQVEVLLVLIGITDPDLFESTIEDELGLTAEEASKIAEEILTRIFIPINDALAVPAPQTTPMKEMGPTPRQPVAVPARDDSATLETIGKNNGLNVSQMGEVEKVISGVVSGKIKAVDMTPSLGRNLPELSKDKLLNLSTEINEKILKIMRNKLQSEMVESSTTEDDTNVLGLAGIEIIGENTPKAVPKSIPLPEKTNTPPEPKKETLPIVQELELKGETIPTPQPAKSPAFAQKLSGTVQTSSTKTEHSIPEKKATENSTKSYPKGQDPYRLPPL